MSTEESSKIAKGIKIDSTLIQAEDVQDELKSLGVKAYNQDDFEAGVLKQIDDEVQRQTKEQDKKFLLKDYNNVKADINAVKNELNQISKTIADLLSQPITAVAGRLRELRSAQETKTVQMTSLRTKEQEMLRRLTNLDNPFIGSASSSRDVRMEEFGISGGDGGEDETERERLIRMGLITPFESGLGSIISSSSSSSSLSTERSEPFDDKDDDSLKRKAHIELINDDVQTLPKILKKKGKEKTAATSGSISAVLEEAGARDAGEASMEESTQYREDLDYYVPDQMDQSSPSCSESEYFTDEELGKVKSKKKMKLRELSSDGSLSSSEDEGRRKRKGKKKGGKAKRHSFSYNDDGNRQNYILRIKEYEKQKAMAAEEEYPDGVLEGGYRVPGTVWQNLYRYQRTGVRWLWELHRYEAGGIVGDEMGLGKTIQIIAFLAGLDVSGHYSHFAKREGLGPVLILCPATVLLQWVSEFHKWWPPFRVAVLHGSGNYGGSKAKLIRDIVQDCGVLLTTYTGMRMSKDLLLSKKWEYLILDEGHKIRNPDAEITIVCKQVKTPHRLILSGSPMQNNLRELWSLFDFVFPGKLGTLPVFLEQFSLPITNGGYANASQVQVQTAYKCACTLRDTIHPYMLRRLKKNVKLDIPNMHEKVLFCCLTDYQYELYRDYVQGPSVQDVLKYGRMVFSAIMTLRKLCNHPDLVTNEYSMLVTRSNRGVGGGASGERAEEDEEGSFDVIPVSDKIKGKKRKTKEAASVEGRSKDAEMKEEGLREDGGMVDEEDSYGFWRRSGKMVVVNNLLKSWKKLGHRVLLFSQSRGMLNVLERFLRHYEYSYLRMDGCTAVGSRQRLINNFNKNPSIFVFLLTTRVGGLGVNLTGANRVIVYDPDWNPSTDIQAQERAFRIGQTREVTVYRLLTSGTIEEKIYHRQIFKQFLTNKILQDPRQRRFFKSNSLMELFTLDASAIDGKGGTETSDIFAGTGSEILPQDMPKRKRKREERDRGKGKEKRTAGSDNGAGPSLVGHSGEMSGTDRLCMSSGTSRIEIEDGEGAKRKKKKKKKRDRPVKVEGEVIKGVAGSCTHEHESKEEADTEEYILRSLFKKGGVHTALHHDAIMKSSDPDYVLVEAEAVKASKSATKALKESRRLCRQSGVGHGTPTWTGQRGLAGAPAAVRFGSKPSIFKSSSATAKGQSSSRSQDTIKKFVGLKSSSSGSTNTSSNVLLARMRQRNTHITPGGNETGVGVAGSAHQERYLELARELRDFVALRGKVNGQVTTSEVVEKFDGLPAWDSAVLRQLLRDICDFERINGTALWILKHEYK